jgi:hypothetical protein
MRRMLIVCLGTLLGCSEYDLIGKDGTAGTEDRDRFPDTEDAPSDTASPPPIDTGAAETCDEWLPGTPAAVPVDNNCIAEPSIGSFTPVVEWQWQTNPTYSDYDDIMAAPAIGNLNDDNGDGRVDEDDIPDIVFASFSGGAYSSAGTITAISGDGSGTLWSVMDAGGYGFYSSSGVAIGDLEADGQIEVCVSGTTTAVVCLNGVDGSLKWAAGTERSAYGCPAMADLRGDGLAEVIYGRQVFDHTGALVFHGTEGAGGSHYMSFAIDWDGDPELEIVAGRTVYDPDGTIVWSDPSHDGAPAVGDFNMDGRPDLVRVIGGSIMVSLNDGTVLWTAALPGGGSGGPPTVADFDGDGVPEVGVADLSTYSVFDTDGTIMWSNPTSDYSSSKTGSSVFDFEGDGAAEVVYADEYTLWIYDGATGAVVLEQDGHASGTLMEYPLIADVDNDGSTEIILASNNYTKTGWNGITVIGDADDSWAPARPIWNQYAYHITNINNDGTIPRVQTKNWLTWNNFRAGGTELGPAHWQADLRIGPKEICDVECGEDLVIFYLSTHNHGPLAAVDFDVVLEREGPMDLLNVPVLPPGHAKMVGPFMLTREEWEAGSISARVNPDLRVSECREGNNSFELGAWPCE